jgi:hypothetical protein
VEQVNTRTSWTLNAILGGAILIGAMCAIPLVTNRSVVSTNPASVETKTAPTPLSPPLDPSTPTAPAQAMTFRRYQEIADAAKKNYEPIREKAADQLAVSRAEARAIYEATVLSAMADFEQSDAEAARAWKRPEMDNNVQEMERIAAKSEAAQKYETVKKKATVTLLAAEDVAEREYFSVIRPAYAQMQKKGTDAYHEYEASHPNPANEKEDGIPDSLP